jgi:hypothetical protein
MADLGADSCPSQGEGQRPGDLKPYVHRANLHRATACHRAAAVRLTPVTSSPLPLSPTTFSPPPPVVVPQFPAHPSLPVAPVPTVAIARSNSSPCVFLRQQNTTLPPCVARRVLRIAATVLPSPSPLSVVSSSAWSAVGRTRTTPRRSASLGCTPASWTRARRTTTRWWTRRRGLGSTPPACPLGVWSSSPAASTWGWRVWASRARGVRCVLWLSCCTRGVEGGGG